MKVLQVWQPECQRIQTVSLRQFRHKNESKRKSKVLAYLLCCNVTTNGWANKTTKRARRMAQPKILLLKQKKSLQKSCKQCSATKNKQPNSKFVCKKNHPIAVPAVEAPPLDAVAALLKAAGLNIAQCEESSDNQTILVLLLPVAVV